MDNGNYRSIAGSTADAFMLLSGDRWRVEAFLGACEAAHPEIAARIRFPGPNYCEVLRWLHEDFQRLGATDLACLPGQFSLCVTLPGFGIDQVTRCEMML